MAASGRWIIGLVGVEAPVEIEVRRVSGHHSDEEPVLVEGLQGMTFRFRDGVTRFFPWANIVEAQWQPKIRRP